MRTLGAPQIDAELPHYKYSHPNIDELLDYVSKDYRTYRTYILFATDKGQETLSRFFNIMGTHITSSDETVCDEAIQSTFIVLINVPTFLKPLDSNKVTPNQYDTKSWETLTTLSINAILTFRIYNYVITFESINKIHDIDTIRQIIANNDAIITAGLNPSVHNKNASITAIISAESLYASTLEGQNSSRQHAATLLNKLIPSALCSNTLKRYFPYPNDGSYSGKSAYQTDFNHSITNTSHMMNAVKSRHQSAPVKLQQRHRSSTVRDARNNCKQTRAQKRAHAFQSDPPAQWPEATHFKRTRKPSSEHSNIPQLITIQDDISIASTIASVRNDRSTYKVQLGSKRLYLQHGKEFNWLTSDQVLLWYLEIKDSDDKVMENQMRTHIGEYAKIKGVGASSGMKNKEEMKPPAIG